MMASVWQTPYLVISLLCFDRIVGSYVVDNSDGLGRRFDGIGGLSGGGATSKLLVSFPEPQRSQILDYLFKPNFAASLQILKVEIGGDSQSTDGTESSHMHEEYDENYQRGYEWWLMVEAKKRNPDIKLYALPWAFPGWLGRGSGSPYKYPNLTAGYIVKWVLGAKKYYNLDIDYVGIWNERNYDVTYIKTLRQALDNSGLVSVRIVAADEKWEISTDILADSDLANDVDTVGCHYPGTLTTVEALQTGKQLWASEDFSTFNDDVGGGCWARILNQNYVNGFMTSTISWNLIASYYKGLPYYRDGLMTAVEAWTGHYSVDSPIWVTAHTTQFTEIGWTYLRHGQGTGHLDKGGSFVSLVSPDEKDITIVIETMSHDHSICIRPKLPPYDVHPQIATFQLKGRFVNVSQLNVWVSRFYYNGTASSYFNKQGPIQVKDGSFSLPLGVDEVYTLTTLPRGQKGGFPAPPPSKPDFPLPYTDNFESYTTNQEPFYLAPQTGVWEVMKTQRGNVARQMVLQQPIDWCKAVVPYALIGDINWANVSVQVDANLLPLAANGSSRAMVSARVDRGGCGSDKASGIFFWIDVKQQKYLLTSDLLAGSILTSGPVPLERDTWYTLGLTVKGTTASGFLNKKRLFQVDIPSKPPNGYVAIGTDSFGHADFDNLMITNV